MLIFLCAVVSKTLIFLTFSPFCQNSSSLSAIIYYLSDTCIFQGFSLWKMFVFFTGLHLIKIKRNKNSGVFWPFRLVSCLSGMAWEKTAHRPPSRLALSPPSKIKAPCRFFIRPGKHSSFFKIPYQSPKKCLKTQITTFSILKFSPKTKNTPVLTVFTLFLLSSYYYSHHPAVCAIVILLLLSSCCYCHHSTVRTIIQLLSPFWRFHGVRHIAIIVYLPPSISILKFHGVLSDSEIPGNTIPKVPQKRFVLKFFSGFILVF